MWKRRPPGSGVTWKRRSRPGWLRSSGKAASLSVWLLGLMRYQLRTKCSGLLEKLQVKVAFAPSGTVSRAGEKVGVLQGLLGASEGWREERWAGVRKGCGDSPPDPPLPLSQGPSDGKVVQCFCHGALHARRDGVLTSHGPLRGGTLSFDATETWGQGCDLALTSRPLFLPRVVV